ncbi:hypothetical protein KORDIASMS9_00189 [Kordia sp. SMS9]|uniref:DUF6565 domain-containing protein n=1 Tax=Kordia sp. SMS9 TaxID=2282170 RepID=UPI000E0DD406|nr:DUF6565 domain-containing protein [Kordia sp. SMS9]AXG68005.1 hypothetical protein KORDIASMS9_00189 [Kordia sp. SMS9]
MKYFYLSFLLLLLSCHRTTKEEYLGEYQNFIKRIKSNWASYSEKDWSRETVLYETYSKIDYKKFKNQLTMSEKIRVHRYDFAFHLYKGDISIKKILSGEYNAIFKEFAYEFKEILKELLKFPADIRIQSLLKIVDQLIE